MPTDTSPIALNAGQPSPRHHIDKRAAKLAAELAEGDPDELLDTSVFAELLGVSSQWLEIGRSKGYGPPFVVFGPRRIRYRRGTARLWLLERTFTRTSEYPHKVNQSARKAGDRVVDGKLARAGQ